MHTYGTRTMRYGMPKLHTAFSVHIICCCIQLYLSIAVFFYNPHGHSNTTALSLRRDLCIPYERISIFIFDLTWKYYVYTSTNVQFAANEKISCEWDRLRTVYGTSTSTYKVLLFQTNNHCFLFWFQRTLTGELYIFNRWLFRAQLWMRESFANYWDENFDNLFIHYPDIIITQCLFNPFLSSRVQYYQFLQIPCDSNKRPDYLSGLMSILPSSFFCHLF